MLESLVGYSDTLLRVNCEVESLWIRLETNRWNQIQSHWCPGSLKAYWTDQTVGCGFYGNFKHFLFSCVGRGRTDKKCFLDVGVGVARLIWKDAGFQRRIYCCNKMSNPTHFTSQCSQWNVWSKYAINLIHYLFNKVVTLSQISQIDKHRLYFHSDICNCYIKFSL